MDNYKYLNTKSKIKDTSKGHKIAAALYLVTNHLSDNDPLKNSIRTHAVNLVTLAGDNQIQHTVEHLSILLETALLAQIISEKNASILLLELRHYVALITSESTDVSSMFIPVFDDKPVVVKNPAHIQVSFKSPIINNNKSKRQDTILSFINERKSAGIKDIAALFTDTSEKTIQRELGALVSAGKITKRGEKRWSVYFSL
jgi:hypothetical protein